MKVSDKKALARAVEQRATEIEVVGSYAGTIKALLALKKSAWLVALGAAGAGTLAAPVSGGLSLGLALTATAGTVGFGTFSAIVALSAIGGASLLSNLRKYKVVSYSEHSLKLKREGGV